VNVNARGLLVAAARIAVVGTVGVTLAALVPAWPFALFEHFRFQYVWGGALVVAACAALRMRGWFDAALIAMLLDACFVLPDLSSRERALPAGAPVRILVVNVLSDNASFDAVARLVADTKPDIVGLLEVTPRWLGSLAPAFTDYPHRVEEPHERGNFGIAVYSRVPLKGGVEALGSQLPTIVATADVQGGAVGLVVTHTMPPVDTIGLDMQLSQLDAVARRAHELGGRVIVMGDLNATPWSAPFRGFVAATGLCDTRAGFGLQASFPASSLVMRIPLDHVLVSCAIGVRSRIIERDVGSDHLPVLVDLVVPR
jgi:endonuclease/exonuclease/phosphatase (EEP) superfamily protein YafD